MDRDNVRLALGIEDRPVGDAPTHAVGPGGNVLPVLWSDSILFQKMQHFAHGDVRQSDYLDYLHGRIESGERLLPLYMNDAEVFDYRPGRFGSESRLHPERLRLVSPEQCLATAISVVSLSSLCQERLRCFKKILQIFGFGKTKLLFQFCGKRLL